MASRSPRAAKAGTARRAKSAPPRPAGSSADAGACDAVDPALPPAQLIEAGLKALGVHGEAVTRHNRVFEALLGVDPSAAPRPVVPDLFRLPTFDGLFDERVARSLERLGVTQALADLGSRLDTIDQRLRRLEQRLAKRAPAAKR